MDNEKKELLESKDGACPYCGLTRLHARRYSYNVIVSCGYCGNDFLVKGYDCEEEDKHSNGL